MCIVHDPGPHSAVCASYIRCCVPCLGALNAQAPTPFQTPHQSRIPVIGPADLEDLDEVDEDEQPMEALRLFQGFDGSAFQECVAKVRTMAIERGCELQDAPSLQSSADVTLSYIEDALTTVAHATVNADVESTVALPIAANVDHMGPNVSEAVQQAKNRMLEAVYASSTKNGQSNQRTLFLRWWHSRINQRIQAFVKKILLKCQETRTGTPPPLTKQSSACQLPCVLRMPVVLCMCNVSCRVC